MPGKIVFLPLVSAIGTLFCLQLVNNSSLFFRARPQSIAERCEIWQVPREFQRKDHKSRCDELIPRYDMAQWLRERGRVSPDHPAVFVNTSTHEAEVFPDVEAFLARYGQERIVAKPEYAASGGHLMDPTAQGIVNVTLRQLPEIWNATYLYVNEFKCQEGSLCVRIAQQFGQPALFRGERIASRNFLFGGIGSGLPFHKHGQTWQGLSLGRKAWYIVPPGSMSERIHNLTGPYIFPARAFHGDLLQEPVGQRPLFCVQHKGEVLYVPENWWHATLNLDAHVLAYGEKPHLPESEKPASNALGKIMHAYPPKPWDSAGDSPHPAVEGQTPMVYSIAPRLQKFETTCGDGVDELDNALRWMRRPNDSRAMLCGLADVAAWTHCLYATRAQFAYWHTLGNRCSPAPVSVGAKLAEMQQHMDRWKKRARELSPVLTQRESKRCGK